MPVRTIVQTLAGVFCLVSASLLYASDEIRSDEFYDYLVGWYSLPDSSHRPEGPDGPHLIPVLKYGDSYFTVGVMGYEVPLKKSPAGLEWGIENSSLQGTTIGFDDKTNEHFLILVDEQRWHHDQFFESGEKHKITKVPAPEGLLSAKAERPESVDDMLGWYQPVWFAPIRIEVKKHEERYGVNIYNVEADGSLSLWSDHELTPASNGLGFSHKDKFFFNYDEDLQRYELIRSGGLKSSLAKIQPSASQPAAATPPLKIGVPAWN